jgi:hypothetical protein
MKKEDIKVFIKLEMVYFIDNMPDKSKQHAAKTAAEL